MIPSLLIIGTVIAHSGQVLRGPSLYPYGEAVYVETCTGNLRTIYADRQLTVPTSNPLITDQYGGYRYYDLGGSRQLVVLRGAKRVVLQSDCPEPKGLPR